MLLEVAERLGPSLHWWLEAPFALALWSFHQLQEADRRSRWVARVQALEAAELMMLAYHKPERLVDERSKVLADAGRRRLEMDTAQLLERGERLARFIRKGQVLVS